MALHIVHVSACDAGLRKRRSDDLLLRWPVRGGQRRGASVLVQTRGTEQTQAFLAWLQPGSVSENYGTTALTTHVSISISV